MYGWASRRKGAKTRRICPAVSGTISWEGKGKIMSLVLEGTSEVGEKLLEELGSGLEQEKK